MRRKVMKDDSGVSKAQAWGCPMHPQEIFKVTQASKLGDALVSPSPSTINISSFSTLYFYHFMCYVLYLERLAFTFQFPLLRLLLLVVHRKLDPSLPCLREKHTPLSPRILIVGMHILVECSLFF